MRSHRLTRVTVATLATVLGLAPILAIAPLAVLAMTPTITIETSDAIVLVGETVTVTVRLIDSDTGDPIISGGGSITIGHYPNNSPQIVNAATPHVGVYEYEWLVPFGPNRIGASWDAGGATYVSGSVTVLAQRASTTVLTIDEPTVEGKPLTFHVAVESGGNNFEAEIVDIRDVDLDQVVASVDLEDSDQVTLLNGASGGAHTYVAEFPGYGNVGDPPMILPSASAPVTIDLDEDTSIEAAAPTVTATTFYPVADGYKDYIYTKIIANERLHDRVEVWSVTTGKRVRTLLEWPGYTDGVIDTSWDGKAGNGKLVPAGKYTFVHVLSDPWGNTTTVTTGPITASAKKLVWHTISSKTKQGRSYELKGATGGGSVKTSTSAYSGGVRIRSGGGFAAVTYGLRLAKLAAPSNAVAKRLTFSVNGKGISGGKADIGIYNETFGEYYYSGSFDVRRLTSSKAGWHATATGSIAVHIDGHTVYGLVQARGTFDINDVKATLKYAVLK